MHACSLMLPMLLGSIGKKISTNSVVDIRKKSGVTTRLSDGSVLLLILESPFHGGAISNLKTLKSDPEGGVPLQYRSVQHFVGDFLGAVVYCINVYLDHLRWI